jgi:hypothetical protein
MSMNQLTLRSIDELKGESFHVPSYQRGYRWSRTQVVELLDDVWDFVRDNRKAKGEFYCLQPVVVAPLVNGLWSVVDGQQRLTTIFLILSYFNEGYTEMRRKKLYSIAYETRSPSGDFLRNPQDERRNENIDFFHMAEARDAIREWFGDKAAHLNDIESAFLLNVKVIWYELGLDVKPTEVFQRLNMGKIPLTESELVKALFLRAANFAGDDQRLLQLRQLQIAGEWDDMERRLQDEPESRNEPNRIPARIALRQSGARRRTVLARGRSLSRVLEAIVRRRCPGVVRVARAQANLPHTGGVVPRRYRPSPGRLPHQRGAGANDTACSDQAGSRRCRRDP